MVVEETGPKSGDISPIAGSMSNLTEVVIVPEGEVKEKVEKATPRKREPSSTIQPNFSRVTPAQIAYISFPGEGRYQPVRSVTASSGKTGKNGKNSVQVARALSTSRYAGGGGILLLVDSKPEEEEELIEWKEEAAPAPTVEANAPAAMVVDATVPEAAPPEPFEVRCSRNHGIITLILSSSIRLIEIHSILLFPTIFYIL
jgi:26S proteasome regulatory subunit N2